jgi:uncharacterized membrane protein
MYSKFKIFGHPVHPMLVGFPIAFYTGTLACYLVYLFNPDPFLFKMGYVVNAAGVIMAGAAVIPGFVDWLNIPVKTKPKRTGLLHMCLNVFALIFFLANWIVQTGQLKEGVPYAVAAVFLSAIGFGLTIIAGFLGANLVEKYHVGVKEREEE